MKHESRAAIFWSIANAIGTRGSSFIFFLALGRMLGPAIFGVVATAASIILFLDALVEFKLSVFVITSDTIDDNLISSIFWLQAIAGIVLFSLLVISSDFLGNGYGDPRLAHVLSWIALCVFINSLGNIQDALLRRSLSFRIITIRNMLANICGGLSGIISAYLGLGIDSMIVMILVNSTVATLSLWFASKWRPRLRLLHENLWSILVDSSYLAASAIGSTLILQLNLFLIGMFFGSSGSGLYAFSLRIYDVVMRLTTFSVSEAAFPILANLTTDKVEYKRNYLELLQAGSAPAVAILVLGASTSQYFVPLIFTSAWQGAVPLLELLLITGAVITFGALNDVTIIAFRKNKAIALTQLYGLFLFLCQLLVMQRFGVLFVVFVWAFKEISVYPWKAIIAMRLMNLDFRDYLFATTPTLGAGFIALLIAGLVSKHLFGDPFMSLLFALTAGILTYVITYVFLRRL